MMSYGYDPQLSEGSLKCPIFQTSTFVFNSAEEGKSFFEVAYGLRPRRESEKPGLIYSRINNPDMEILENRLCLWDDAEEAAVFESGMSAISTTLLECLKPGDLLVHSEPIYGGTDHFINHVLSGFGIHSIGFYPGTTEEELISKIKESGLGDKLSMIFIETPANPTNDLIDIAMCKRVADQFRSGDSRPVVAVDNTYLGPIFQHPLKHGADLVLYSATKYIGGHSDVIAGACLGNSDIIKRIKVMRTFLGSMCGPWTSWLLMRSLETLKVRMEKQASNSKLIADYLKGHPLVERVHFLGHLKPGDPQYQTYSSQCLSHGAMVSFHISGGEAEAFRFLNNLKLIKLAVSLGGTESLAEHPATMTHVDVDPALREKLGVNAQLVRLSIGIEHPDDIIDDIRGAMESVPLTKTA
jgi:methionine-gamma-lyase